MLKYKIYINDGQVFEDHAYRALMITVMTTKKKAIRNFPGNFKGVLDKLVDDTYGLMRRLSRFITLGDSVSLRGSFIMMRVNFIVLQGFHCVAN